MNSIIEKCKTTRILGAIGIIALILGTMLPYVQYNIFGHTYSLALWGYWEGKIVMALAIANLLFIFKDFVEKYIPSLFCSGIGKKIQSLENPKYSLVPTILAAIFIFYLTLHIHITFKYYNIGFYLVWLGTICLVAYALIHKQENITTNIQNS